MSTIEEIPADQLIEMTPLLHRLFNAGGCDPACHGCWNKIPVGEKFKLSTLKLAQSTGTGFELSESKEVMLCENCQPENVQENQNKKTEYKALGCFRVNGKIAKHLS